MTLVAAYKQDGVPILLGDFLITNRGLPAGIRKKICRITPNLAVGWSGSQIAAEVVTREMREWFAESRPSTQEVEDFLKSYPAEEKLGTLAVQLAGWIVGPEPVCFSWRSDWPVDVHYGPHHYMGSGADRFIALAGEGEARGDKPPSHSARPVLFNACKLMADEIGAQQNRTAGFGFAYEILYLEGADLVYLDDVMIMFAEVDFAHDGEHMASRIVPFLYRYSSLGELTLLQILRSDECGAWTAERHIISPPFGAPQEELESLANRFFRPNDPLAPIGSRISLLLTLVRDANTSQPFVLPPLILDQWPGDSGQLFRLTFEPSESEGSLDGTFGLEIDQGFLDWSFATIVKDQRSH